MKTNDRIPVQLPLLVFCKINGLKSVTELFRLTGTSRITLYRWCKTKPDLLRSVIYGAARLKREKVLRITLPIEK